MSKFRYKVVFLRLINNVYVFDSSKTFKKVPEPNIVNHRDGSYIVDFGKPSYLSKVGGIKKYNTYIYLMDIKEMNQITFIKSDFTMNPKLLKLILKCNVMSQIGKSLNDEYRKPNYTLIILFSIFSALVSGLGVYAYCNTRGA